MSNHRRITNPELFPQHILLPTLTLAVVALVFYLSTAYDPTWTYNWQGIRPAIRDTVQLIERYGSITSGRVGMNTRIPQQWHRRRWLISNATEAELRQLVNYPKGVVKATAYEGLLRQSYDNCFEWMEQALNDTTAFIIYRSGCIGFPIMIGEYLMEYVIPISDRGPPPAPATVPKHDLTPAEIRKLRALYDQRMEQKEVYLRSAY